MPAADTAPSASTPVLEDWQVLDFLVALVEKSLVVFDDGGSGDSSDGQTETGRYRLLETTRQYGAERLAQSEADEINALRRRHRAYYLRFAESAVPHLHGLQAASYIAAFASDHDNLRVALNGFVEGASDPVYLEKGARLCAALFEFWSLRGLFNEGRDYCRTFLELDKSANDALPSSLRATLLRACGSFWGYLNEAEASQACLRESLVLDRAAQNHTGISEALVGFGIIAKHKGDNKAARAFFDEGLAEARLGGDGRAIAIALINIAHLVTDPPEQIALHEESLAIFRKQGDNWGVAQSLGNLGWIKQVAGDEDGAFVYYEECRRLRESLGDQHGLGWLLRGMAQTAFARGDREAALACYRDAIEIFRTINNREGIAWMQFYSAMAPVGDNVWPDGEEETALQFLRDALRNFVAMKEPASIQYVLEGFAFRLVLSDPEKAALLWGGGRKLRDELGSREEVEGAALQKARQMARDALGGEAGWNEAFERGRALSTDEAVQIALTAHNADN